MKTAIVFGATGLVGKELIFELIEHSEFDKVKAVVRNTLPFSNPKLEQIVHADFLQLDPLASSLSGDVFFCCIGTTIKKAGSQDVFRKTDLSIPVEIARLAASLQIPNLVVISSIGASAQTSNFYLRTKGEMEKQVQSTYHGNLKIVRPSFLVGHRSEFRLGEKIGIIIAKIIAPFMIGSLNKYKGIAAWDVARAMICTINTDHEKIWFESNELQTMAQQARPSESQSRHIIH